MAFDIQIKMSLLIIFLWLKDTTGWSPSEEVKVCHSVHLNIIKVYFVIRLSIYLRRVMISVTKPIIFH